MSRWDDDLNLEIGEEFQICAHSPAPDYERKVRAPRGEDPTEFLLWRRTRAQSGTALKERYEKDHAKTQRGRGVPPRVCRECQTPLPAAAGVHGRIREFCSGRCRVKAHRRR